MLLVSILYNVNGRGKTMNVEHCFNGTPIIHSRVRYFTDWAISDYEWMLFGILFIMILKFYKYNVFRLSPPTIHKKIFYEHDFQNLVVSLLSGKQHIKYTYYATLRCINIFVYWCVHLVYTYYPNSSKIMYLSLNEMFRLIYTLLPYLTYI
jgi:hypothetical protein